MTWSSDGISIPRACRSYSGHMTPRCNDDITQHTYRNICDKECGDFLGHKLCHIYLSGYLVQGAVDVSTRDTSLLEELCDKVREVGVYTLTSEIAHLFQILHVVLGGDEDNCLFCRGYDCLEQVEESTRLVFLSYREVKDP